MLPLIILSLFFYYCTDSVPSTASVFSVTALSVVLLSVVSVVSVDSTVVVNKLSNVTLSHTLSFNTHSASSFQP